MYHGIGSVLASDGFRRLIGQDMVQYGTVWHENGTCIVRVRYVYGTCTVHVRYVYGTCTARVGYV